MTDSTWDVEPVRLAWVWFFVSVTAVAAPPITTAAATVIDAMTRTRRLGPPLPQALIVELLGQSGLIALTSPSAGQGYRQTHMKQSPTLITSVHQFPPSTSPT